MAHQSSDLGLGQRVRAAMAVTVAVFTLSLSYWGVLVRQESQASATNTVINFDDRAQGTISSTAYPNLLIQTSGQPIAAAAAIHHPQGSVHCGDWYSGNLLVTYPVGGNNPILDVTFTDNQVSDNFSLNVPLTAFNGNILVTAFDVSGATIDTKTVSPVANECINPQVSFNSTTGIAHVHIQSQGGDGSWGIDNLSYSALRTPTTNFGFTATPLTGTAPLTVTATYTGQGSPTPPLTWDFGDGQVVENGSTTLTHTYTSVGTYPIKLTSGTFVAQNTVIVSAAIPLPTPLSFSVTPMTGTAPLTVTGSSPTSPSGITRSWNWGDSSIPSQQVPTIGANVTSNWQDLSHTYTAPGTYIVVVTQTEGIGTANPETQTGQKTVIVSANTINDATLTTSKSVYDVGEQVQFTLTNIGSNTLTLANTAPFNIKSGTTTIFSPIGGQVITQLTTGKYQNWTWDQKNTTSTQVAEGVYTVTVSYTNGVEAKTKSATFTVAKQALAPTFTYKIDPTSGTAPLTIKATVTGAGADTTSPLWDFGDGTTATGVSVSHTYASAGTYTATIRIGSQVGTQQVIVSNAIVNASPAPKKLAQTGISLSLVLLIALIVSGVLSYLIIRRPFHSNK